MTKIDSFFWIPVFWGWKTKAIGTILNVISFNIHLKCWRGRELESFHFPSLTK